jgi:hypothetical protein
MQYVSLLKRIYFRRTISFITLQAQSVKKYYFVNCHFQSLCLEVIVYSSFVSDCVEHLLFSALLNRVLYGAVFRTHISFSLYV